MADVGLDGPDAAEIHRVGLGTVGFGQRGNLDGVAQIGAGAVTFDHADALRSHARVIQRPRDGLRLAVHGRCKIARLLRAVVVDGRTLDHGPDVIPVGDRILEPPQRHAARAGAKDSALRPVIEGMAVPVGRQDFVFLEFIAAPMRQFDRDTPRQRHVDLARAQRLAGIVDRHQGRGTGRLQVDRRAVQVEDVADARGQKVLVVAGMAQKEHAHVVHEVGVRADVEVEIAAHAAARIDADGAPDGLGRVACLFHRLPGNLEKLSVLGVENGSILGRKAEEIRVKRVKPFKHRGSGNVVAPCDPFGAFASVDQGLLAQVTDRFHPVAEVGPIGIDVRRAGDVDRKANDRDVMPGGGAGCFRCHALKNDPIPRSCRDGCPKVIYAMPRRSTEQSGQFYAISRELCGNLGILAPGPCGLQGNIVTIASSERDCRRIGNHATGGLDPATGRFTTRCAFPSAPACRRPAPVLGRSRSPGAAAAFPRSPGSPRLSAMSPASMSRSAACQSA